MANPYHDETGRFCSKEEMGAAVDRVYATIATAKNPVELAQATDAWFELRTDFESAQRAEPRRLSGVFPHQVNIPPLPAPAPFGEGLPTPFSHEALGTPEWLDECATAGRQDYADLTEKQLVALGKALRQSELATPGSKTQLAAADFYKDAPPAVKAEVLIHMRERSLVGEEIARRMLASELGSSREVVDAVLSNTELPTEDKLKLARLHNRLAYLAPRNPRAVIDNAEYERDLLSEIRCTDTNLAANERQAGWQQLAVSSASPATLAEIRSKFVSGNNYDPSIVGKFAQNYNLSAEDSDAVLRATMRNSDVNLWITSLGYMAGRASRGDAEAKARGKRLEDLSKRYTQLVAEGSSREAAAQNATQEYLTGTLDGEAARQAPVNRLRPIR